VEVHHHLPVEIHHHHPVEVHHHLPVEVHHLVQVQHLRVVRNVYYSFRINHQHFHILNNYYKNKLRSFFL
jgi:hypothetical protein